MTAINVRQDESSKACLVR